MVDKYINNIQINHKIFNKSFLSQIVNKYIYSDNQRKQIIGDRNKQN